MLKRPKTLSKLLQARVMRLRTMKRRRPVKWKMLRAQKRRKILDKFSRTFLHNQNRYSHRHERSWLRSENRTSALSRSPSSALFPSQDPPPSLQTVSKHNGSSYRTSLTSPVKNLHYLQTRIPKPQLPRQEILKLPTTEMSETKTRSPRPSAQPNATNRLPQGDHLLNHY